jgi:hypothetical protein
MTVALKRSTRDLIWFLVIAALAQTPASVAAKVSSSLVEMVPSGPIKPPVVPGRSPWAGGVTLATAFLGWLSDQGLKSSIEAKVESLKTQINSAMPPSGGVLIVIGIQQSAQPDVNGRYNRSVLDGYVGGAGATAKATMDAYLKQDRLEQGVSSGFVRRNVYFWKPSPPR